MSAEDVYDSDRDVPGAPPRSHPGQSPNEKVYDQIVDENGRVISLKPANRAVLAARAKRRAHEARLKARPAQRFSWSNLLLLLLFMPLLSTFTTNTYTFHLASRLAPVAKWIETAPINPFRRELKTFSPQALSRFDGSDRWLPVYVGIMGEVYDVSKNRRIYGKGGGYNMMAGRDASRSFVTGCFQTHLTHDLRGLTTEQLKTLESWRSFFAKHKDYRLVGRVANPPIDPAAPIPPPCDTADSSSSGLDAAKSRAHSGRKQGPVRPHEEL